MNENNHEIIAQPDLPHTPEKVLVDSHEIIAPSDLAHTPAKVRVDSHEIIAPSDLPHTPAKVRADYCESSVPCIALMQRSSLRWFFLIGVLFMPFVVAACFIVVTREWIIVNTWWDYLGWAGSIAVGLFCVWQLPINRLSRALITVIYTPIVGLFLVDFFLEFIGHRYGRWL